MMKKSFYRVELFVLFILMFLSGCAALVVGDVTQGGYAVSQNDASLRNAIEHKLKADSLLRDYRLVAHSVDGNVSLHGTVSSRSQEARAVQIARSITGVRKVVSKVTILTAQ